MTYEMKCDCGKTVSVEAASREEAIQMIKGIMTEDAIKEHMASEHPGQQGRPAPSRAHDEAIHPVSSARERIRGGRVLADDPERQASHGLLLERIAAGGQPVLVRGVHPAGTHQSSLLTPGTYRCCK